MKLQNELTNRHSTAAQLTPQGRGAVATIAFLGSVSLIDSPTPLFAARNGKLLQQQPINQICFGHWGEEPAEDVVVCRTEEDRIEIHCHGGRAAVERILQSLRSRGVEVTDPWSVVGDTDAWIDRECQQALCQATTRRCAAILAAQASGLLREEFAFIRAETDSERKIRQLNELLKWSEFGRHLTQPWSVVLCGPPNVGKSSLINRLLGYGRAIVYDQPGTTRDIVTGQTAFDGWPVELSDTAGLRETEDAIELEGVRRARGLLEQADAKVIVIDAERPDLVATHDISEQHPGAILVVNKVDLLSPDSTKLPPDTIFVSAETGEGIEELMAAISRSIVPVVPGDQQAVPVSQTVVDRIAILRERICSESEGEVEQLWKRIL